MTSSCRSLRRLNSRVRKSRELRIMCLTRGVVGRKVCKYLCWFSAEGGEAPFNKLWIANCKICRSVSLEGSFKTNSKKERSTINSIIRIALFTVSSLNNIYNSKCTYKYLEKFYYKQFVLTYLITGSSPIILEVASERSSCTAGTLRSEGSGKKGKTNQNIFIGPFVLFR